MIVAEAAPLCSAPTASADEVRSRIGDLLEYAIRKERGLAYYCARLFTIRSEEFVLPWLERLCGAGLNPRASNDGTPLLSIAAEYGHTSSIRFLLKAGAILDGGGVYGVSPLKRALLSVYGIEAASVLIAAGAKIDSTCFRHAPAFLRDAGRCRVLEFVGENRGRLGLLLLAPQLDVEVVRTAAARASPGGGTPDERRAAAELRAAAGWGPHRRAWAGAVVRAQQK